MDRTFLDEAEAIGNRFIADAIRAPEGANWINRDLQETPDPLNRGPIAHTLAEPFYVGLAGVAEFLGRLHEATGSPEYADAANAAGRRSLWGLEKAMPQNNTSPWEALACPSFYGGAVGVLWTAASVARQTGDTELAQRAADGIAHYVQNLAFPARGTDLLGGDAGFLPVILAWEEQGIPGADTLRSRLVDRILGRTVRRPDGIGWPADSETIEGRPLTGLSHGVSGFGLALAVLGATGGPRHTEEILGAIAYESSSRTPDGDHWLDFRTLANQSGGAPSHMVAWCHGAPGIGLQRRIVQELVPEAAEACREDTGRAARSTRKYIDARSPDTAFTYCHGVAGNLDCLLLMSQDAGQAKEHLEYAREVTADRVSAYGLPAKLAWPGMRVDWPMGRPGYSELSLMKGLAGTGHFMLRVHDPRRTPTVLVPPMPNSAAARINRAVASIASNEPRGRADVSVTFRSPHLEPIGTRGGT